MGIRKRPYCRDCHAFTPTVERYLPCGYWLICCMKCHLPLAYGTRKEPHNVSQSLSPTYDRGIPRPWVP